MMKAEEFNATLEPPVKGVFVRHFWYYNDSMGGTGKWQYMDSVRIVGDDGTDPLGAEELLLNKVAEVLAYHLEVGLDRPLAKYAVTGP